MPVSQAQVYALAQRGEALSQALPPLLVRAEKVAASVILGVHGRKTAGPGESFWQYRAYGFGDSTQRVDWHRSARSDKVYIRENEWESANTLWVWANTGPRMDYKSHLADTTKMDRAQILAIAMASLAMRGHERIGALGSPRAAANGRMALNARGRMGEPKACHANARDVCPAKARSCRACLGFSGTGGRHQAVLVNARRSRLERSHSADCRSC